MSSFGTALVIDIPAGADTDPVVQRLAPIAGPINLLSGVSGMQRITAYLDDLDLVDIVGECLLAAGGGHAFIAADYDDFGALWVVLAVRDGLLSTVHRRYILNADPSDPEAVEAAIGELNSDPRPEDVPGAAAAAAAAGLLGMEPDAAVAAERGSGSAWEELGIIGGPFPWWDALQLPWPGGVQSDDVRVLRAGDR